MLTSPPRLAAILLALAGSVCLAEVKITVERRADGPGFEFRTVPPPAANDAAGGGRFELLAGRRDPNGGLPTVLNDGRLPDEEDQPSANFFLAAGTEGGRVVLDLGRVVEVQQVNTYSWHPGARGPQVYRLFGADGSASEFNAAPAPGSDPQAAGWTSLAIVDTRAVAEAEGGQYGVSVADVDQGTLGRYRYLLFDLSRTEDADPFGNTFYSEIDVIEAGGPDPIPATSGAPPTVAVSFEADGGKYRFSIDVTTAPDLKAWAEDQLRPVIQEWYPKLVALLPSDGFVAPSEIRLRFRDDMGGTPASAGGNRINLNSAWFRRELDREARGSVVHEMVHLVQSYGRGRRGGPGNTRPPGWLVEGIADYIRWFLYEPETRGAEITARNLQRARYDASYRITGNFLNWVVNEHDPQLIQKLNAAAREGRYQMGLWEQYTGKTLPELGEAWKRAQEARVAGESNGSP